MTKDSLTERILTQSFQNLRVRGSKTMLTKACSQCGVVYPWTADFFYNSKRSAIGLENICKECRKSNTKKYSNANKDRKKQYDHSYYLKHKDRIQIQSKTWRETHLERDIENRSSYHQAHKAKINMRSRRWREDNRDKHRESVRQWREDNPEAYKAQTRKRYNENKLECNFKTQMKDSLKGKKNGRKWLTLVPYSLAELKTHLMKTMPDGYSWEDYMNGGLHVDHIVPIAAHNFTTPEDIDFLNCWSLSNLRLLPAKENISKGAKLETPFQPALAFGGLLQCS
jgi:hypothetical protein